MVRRYNYYRDNSSQCNCNSNIENNNLMETTGNMMNSMNIISNCNQNNDYINCDECGFESGYSTFPENPIYGQSYVPIQQMNQTYKPQIGLQNGTIFPELVSQYRPGQSMAENQYIATANRNTNRNIQNSNIQSNIQTSNIQTNNISNDNRNSENNINN